MLIRLRPSASPIRIAVAATRVSQLHMKVPSKSGPPDMKYEKPLDTGEVSSSIGIIGIIILSSLLISSIQQVGISISHATAGMFSWVRAKTLRWESAFRGQRARWPMWWISEQCHWIKFRLQICPIPIRHKARVS